MKTLLATAAVLGLTASGALADCAGHTARTETTETVATLDMSTTASTPAPRQAEDQTPASSKAD